MRYRELGRSGLPVSEIGYGAWGIGESAWVGGTETESLRALRRAIDLGVNFIDTARGYGESERLVGRVRERPAPDGLDPADTRRAAVASSWPVSRSPRTSG